jgi:hypothetical protein
MYQAHQSDNSSERKFSRGFTRIRADPIKRNSLMRSLNDNRLGVRKAGLPPLFQICVIRVYPRPIFLRLC